MKEAMQHLADTYLINNGRGGYSPVILFQNYFIPILYKLYPLKFYAIMNEIYVDPTGLEDLDYVYKSYYFGTSINSNDDIALLKDRIN